MSAYTTLHCSRKKALELFHKKKSVNPSNEELERFLEEYTKKNLYNVSVYRYPYGESGPDDDFVDYHVNRED